MQIGQISELSGYSQRMIRYLEEHGLLSPRRSESNLRRFSDHDLTRILKIKRLKELGFTYSEIRNLINQDDSAIAAKGSELLRRHHQEAHDLVKKIQQLEVICFGEIKTKNLTEGVSRLNQTQRTAYRVQKLDLVDNTLKSKFADLKSEVTLWKFIEFLRMQNIQNRNDIEVAEVFRGSSQIVILDGISFLKSYNEAWSEHSLPFNPNHIGRFPFTDVSEFFSHYEIILEHKITRINGEVVFHALLPYQAIFIASGEAVF